MASTPRSENPPANMNAPLGKPERKQTWKCGGKYVYDLPKPKDEPWTELLRPLQSQDAARCDGWKEEVQNLLIFAGLFSAVVTAFVLELYKSLRQDPMELIAAALLKRMGEDPNSKVFSDGFSLPPHVSTRINTLWFLSLVFSLITVLIGTISLQWLREHQRIPDDLEPQIAFSLHVMQAESLDVWLVPHIFNLLSLLLQIALVLFLLGLTELLWIMNRTVGAWVAVAIGLTLLFLVSTTVLPTFQAISLYLPWSPDSPRSPCPYKSPQSWAFHHLVSPIVFAVVQTFGGRLDRYTKIDSRNLMSVKGREDWHGALPHGTGMLFRRKRKDTWLEHSVGWLFQRDYDYLKPISEAEALDTCTHRPVPHFDALKGLLDEKRAAIVTHADFTTVDDCIGSVLAGLNPKLDKFGLYARFVSQMSQSEPFAFRVPSGMDMNEPSILLEDATLRLFSRDTNSIPAQAEQRALEICVRLTAWMYGGRDARPYERNRDSERSLIENLPIHWVAELLEVKGVDSDCLERVRGQISAILLRFFGRIRTVNLLELTPTLDTDEDYVGRFISHAARIITNQDEHSICDELLKCIQHPDTTEYAYQAAFVFCQAIFTRRVSVTPSLQQFIGALEEYELSNSGVFKRCPIAGIRDSSWEAFIEGAKRLGFDVGRAVASDSKLSSPSEIATAQGAADVTIDILYA
ncbi:hypothetical protein DFP72DRAFT_1048830 [Ephemerocybe angulata]|uniref:DUF6535 domain-containing protein n=1 Tax=Ephemerocybe angulata TaxID=980116 RepID=A0A8H6HN58_9AGAR|nr:hypothetical protein DFP72DRAFT_1048830 [Tulosesus angulatus]